MAIFIDVHCHLDYWDNDKIKQAVKNAEKKKIIVITNGINISSNRKTLEICEKYPYVKCALGIYPIDSLSLKDEEIEKEIEFIRKNKHKICAIGEVGLDLKEAGTETLSNQMKVFEKFVNLSKELKIPIIIHSRKAELETIEFLESLNAQKVILHCFSGNMKLVKRAVENKFIFTIPASVKHSTHFQILIKEVPLEQLLCETDSPFLHPDKERDNEPINVIESYRKIAEIKGIGLEKVKAIIFENYKKLFNLN